MRCSRARGKIENSEVVSLFPSPSSCPPLFPSCLIYLLFVSFFFLPSSRRASSYSMLMYAKNPWERLIDRLTLSALGAHLSKGQHPLFSRACLRSDARFAALTLLGRTPSITRVRILWNENASEKDFVGVGIEMYVAECAYRDNSKERVILDRSSANCERELLVVQKKNNVLFLWGNIFRLFSENI